MTSVDASSSSPNVELTGHKLKKIIKDKFPHLTPKSVKLIKSQTFWRPNSWEVAIDTSKVFDTIEEKDTENEEIRSFIYNTIHKYRYDNKYLQISACINWPRTIEELNIQKEKELVEKRKVEERIELEHKKRKHEEEENSELERTFRPKIVKKELGTHEEFMKNMRNEDFDDKVRSLWRKELIRKGEVLMSYPFNELETMKSETSNIETYIQGVVPHVSSGDYREPFFGNMDRVFPKTVNKILAATRNISGSHWSYNYDTFETCIRLYHEVHRNPEGCSVRSLKLYSRIFSVE